MSTVADPVETFERQVKALIVGGMSEQSALKRVAANNPELHRQYLAAVNRKAGHHFAANRLSGQSHDPAENPGRTIEQMARSIDNPIGAYEALVNHVMQKRGMNREQAKGWVGRNRPDMRKEMVDAVNRIHGRSGRLEI